MQSRPARVGSWRRRESVTAYLYVAPALLLVGLFGIFPVLFTVFVSLWKWRILRGAFLGLTNYAEIFGRVAPLLLLLAGIGCIVLGAAALRAEADRRSAASLAARRPAASRSVLMTAAAAFALAAGTALLAWSLPAMYGAGDKDMLDSLRVTVWYSVGTVPVQLALGLVLAVLMNRRIPGRQGFRVVYLLPYVVPSVASATVFERLFSLRPESLANLVLKLLGVPPQEWLAEAGGLFSLLAGGRMPAEAATAIGTYWLGWAQGPSLSLVSIMFYNWWVFVGYYALIYTNGLSNIPRQLYEAAEVDGASKLSAFFRITVPLLSPSTYFLTLLGIIGTFKAFTHIYVLRTPAVRGAADPMSVYIFFTFFRKQSFGYAAALSLVLFAIVIGLTILQQRISERSVHYGD
jgi:multiple sugar transport system permease protein